MEQRRQRENVESVLLVDGPVDLGSVRRGVAERPEEALDEIHETPVFAAPRGSTTPRSGNCDSALDPRPREVDK